MGMGNKQFAVFATIALLLGLVGAAPEAATQQTARQPVQEPPTRIITIGTGGVTGLYYPLGGAICRLLNRERKTHGIRCLVDSTDGSVYNLKAIQAGELNIGLAQSDQQYNAYVGIDAFADGGNKDLRVLFSLHSEAFTVVTQAGSDIETFDDLKGKRVNIGNPGSGQRATMEALMAAKGWTPADFGEVYELGAAQQSRALCDGEVDAIVYTVGHPNRSILESTIACDSVFVAVAGPEVDELVRAHPYYVKTVVPGGMYRDNPEDVPTFGVKATVVTSAGEPEDIIYQVVKAVFDDFEEFTGVHPALARQTKLSMIRDGNSAPLHEGAVRYYREAGLLNEEPPAEEPPAE